MPIKCYNKPVRKEKRKWTECDAARVANNARIDQGISGGVVASTVGLRMGYPILIDGARFSDTVALVTDIEEILRDTETARDLSILIPGSIVKRLVIRLVTSFAGTFSQVLGFIIFRLVANKFLPPPSSCSR